MPTRLDELPFDLLYQILFEVSQNDLKRDQTLVALCLTCKALREIARPLLVHHWHDRRDLLEPFTRHLLDHPELRPHVKKITCEGDLLCPFPVGSWTPILPYLAPLASEAQKEFPDFATALAWDKRLANRDLDAIFTMLLAWATQLQELDMTMPAFSPQQVPCFLWLVYHVVDVALPSNKDPAAALPLCRLQSVTLHMITWDPPRRADRSICLGQAGCISPLFYLPSLRVLRAKRIIIANLESVSEERTGAWWCPKRASPIEELILEEASVEESGILVFTRACKALRKLTLEWVPHIGRLRADDWVQLHLRKPCPAAVLARCISDHAETLEEVKLDMRKASHNFLNWGARLDPIGLVLTRCKKLSSVTVDLSTLYGTHRMPRAPFGGPSPAGKFVPENPEQQSLTLKEILPRTIRRLEVLDAEWVNVHRHPMAPWRQSQRAHHLYDLGETIRQAGPAGLFPDLKTIKCGEWLVGLESVRGRKNSRCAKLRSWLPMIAPLFGVHLITPIV